MHGRSGADGAAVGTQGSGLTERGHVAAAALALAGVAAHLLLRFVWRTPLAVADAPLLAVLAVAGVPLVLALVWRALHGEFGSDHLAGVSIVTSVLLHEYLAGAIVVLMLSGGNALEQIRAWREKHPTVLGVKSTLPCLM